jgi:hypothetical protein
MLVDFLAVVFMLEKALAITSSVSASSSFFALSA